MTDRQPDDSPAQGRGGSAKGRGGSLQGRGAGRAPIETPEQREARRILDRVNTDTEQLGASSLARSALHARDHFAGADADQDDPIEVWGRRIGRGAGLVAVLVLLFWLVNRLTT